MMSQGMCQVNDVTVTWKRGHCAQNRYGKQPLCGRYALHMFGDDVLGGIVIWHGANTDSKCN